MLSFACCPVCRTRLSWSYIWRPLWARWHCRHCGSLLGVNRVRRLGTIILVIPACLLGLPPLLDSSLPSPLASPITLLALSAAVVGMLLLLDRPRVIERCGLRCNQCGYDLRGQTTPRCPECGAEFDPRQQAYLAAGVVPVTTARRPLMLWPLIGVLIILGLLTLVAVWVTSYGRLRPAPRPGSAPPPTFVPLTPPVAKEQP
jgi:hypothetical protein